MTFIKFTSALNGKPLYIDLDRIEAFKAHSMADSLHRPTIGTEIYPTGGNLDVWYWANETPDEVAEIIKVATGMEVVERV